jgi:hypothetical protein
MEEEKKAGVRVMRKSPEELAAGANSGVRSTLDTADETYYTTLSDGREVVLREMMASDLLYLEKSLNGAGDMERSLKLAARMSTGGGKITFDELQKLKMKDLKKVTELLAKAGGTDDEDGDEDPNF